MSYNQFLFIFFIVSIVAIKCETQGEIDTSAEKNEIPYEKYDKSKTKYNENENTTTNVKETKETLKSKETPTTRKLKSVLVCPPKDAHRPLFSLPCFSNSNCGFLGSEVLCCDGRCLKGVHELREDAHQAPILFGIMQGKCPTEPLTEFSEIRSCNRDEECSPRICCRETSGKNKYCRTPIPVWDTVPLPVPVLDSLKAMTSYMQCTQPPPPHLDLYPKICQNPMDCFPNLCCQEKDRKICRPPKRSLLTLVAEVGQRIIPEEAARKFIERIS